MNKILLSLLILFGIVSGCKKSSSGPITATPPVLSTPLVPSNLTITLLSSTQSKLSWTDNSNNEDGFKIERKTSSSSYSVIGNVGTNITTYIDQGLIANTTYTYRVIAFNAVGNSASYSNETAPTTPSSTPIINTSTVDSITTNSAKSGGTISSDGGSAISARGVVWSTSPNPTIVLNTKTNDGTGAGTFTSSVTGLTPNIIYYIKAYAINSTDTAYGNELSFTTLAILLPSVTTSAVNNITYTTAASGGNISSDGGSPVTVRGVCWSTSPNPTISLSTKTNDGTGTGIFVSNITGLTSNTNYYVRAYATNNIGTSYGNELSFSTPVVIVIPSLTTTAISSITSSSAATGGNISSDGGSPVTARGVCWSTSPNPTISLSTITIDGTGMGTFTSSVTGLTPNTNYYLRSYATNSAGTAYGNEVIFTTDYGNVTICSQVWRVKNLDVATYRNGDPIPNVTDPVQWGNLTTGAWCYYNNDPANGTVYGKLYNWYAVNDPRGLAPTGWHVPSDAEWNTLSACLGGNTVAGGALKEAGTTHWYSPNAGATNSSGFTGLPGGVRYDSGNFGGIGPWGDWWSSTQSSPPIYSNSREMTYGGGQLQSNDSLKVNGYSVRCLKD